MFQVQVAQYVLEIKTWPLASIISAFSAVEEVVIQKLTFIIFIETWFAKDYQTPTAYATNNINTLTVFYIH